MVLAFGCHILGLETQDRPGRSEPPLVGSWQCPGGGAYSAAGSLGSAVDAPGQSVGRVRVRCHGGWGEGKGRFWSTLCLAPVPRSVREGKDPLRTSRELTRVGGTSRGVLAFGKGQCTPRYLHPKSKAKRVFLDLEELILGETKG